MPRTRSRRPSRDHDDLCALIRFSFDEPARLSPDEVRARDEHVAKLRTTCRKGGVRASRALLPRVHRLADEAARRLLLREAPEVYVTAMPDLNAFAATDSKGHALCVVHHGLVPLLSDDELLAVLAHEFGHAGLRHGGRGDDSGAAYVYGSQRSCAGEVSADRLAVLAVGAPTVLTSALVKMTCGLSADELSIDVDAVLAQFAHPDNVDEDFDGLDSHPELPFRHWAMTRFAATDVCVAFAGGNGGEPFDAVEREIEDRFHALDEGKAFVCTSELVHQALAWLGCLMIAQDDRVTPRERQALASLVGQVWAEDVCDYARRNGLRAVDRRAREALEPLRHAGLRTRHRIRELLRELGARSRNVVRARRILGLVTRELGRD